MLENAFPNNGEEQSHVDLHILGRNSADKGRAEASLKSNLPSVRNPQHVLLTGTGPAVFL